MVFAQSYISLCSLRTLPVEAKRRSRYRGPACPVGSEDRTGVKCLPNEMKNLFHRGGAYFSGVRD